MTETQTAYGANRTVTTTAPDNSYTISVYSSGWPAILIPKPFHQAGKSLQMKLFRLITTRKVRPVFSLLFSFYEFCRS
jgi:hypothetical protein